MKIIIDYPKTNNLSTNLYNVKFKGLIFADKYESGISSIKYFFDKYKDKFLSHLEDLSGNFVIELENKKTKVKYIFTDNSGMYRLYYDNTNITDNYLKYIKITQKSYKDVDYKGLVEMLQYGYNLFYTPILGTKILKRQQYLEIKKDIIVKDKKIDSLFTKGIDIYDFYKNFKYNFKDKKTACDLTAGTDSRLNASLLKYNSIPFSTSIIGNQDHIDIKKCHELSEILCVPECKYMLEEKIDEKKLENIFCSLDGQYSILEFYKNYELTESLIKDKFNLRISGAGGELYKYSWFAQDFPRFHKKNFALNKVYKNRFYNKSIKYDIYTKKFRNEIEEYQSKLKINLENYRQKTNSKTYDSLCYELIMRYGASTQMINLQNNNYIRYCPLLELKIVRNGVNMSIMSRLLYLFTRKIITKSAPEISNIKTNKGLTTSNNILSLFKDSVKLFNEFVEKVIRKLIKKKRTIEDTANSKLVFNQCRNIDKNMIELLEKNNIINKNMQTDKIDTSTYSRLITISMFLKYLDNNSREN